MKITDDKYYTSTEVATFCILELLKIIDTNTITEVIEPSIGNGAFITPYLKIDKGYDIDPCVIDDSVVVKKTNYLTEPIAYKEGRLVIGNPPYGRCLNLAQKFYDKSVEIADYIAFILPISQLNNTMSMFKFDLILSLDLEEQLYTDRKLHCCFNVYKRPLLGLNKKVSSRSKNIKIIRQDSKKYEEESFDLRMCYWGNGSAGKILGENEHYSAEYKIQVLNEAYKEKVIDVLTTFDWSTYLNCIAMRKIQQFHIIDVLRKEIEGFE